MHLGRDRPDPMQLQIETYIMTLTKAQKVKKTQIWPIDRES